MDLFNKIKNIILHFHVCTYVFYAFILKYKYFFFILIPTDFLFDVKINFMTSDL